MRFYLSHSIRGKYGKDATDEQRKENCEVAILLGSIFRNMFPKHEFYVPGDHEFPPVGRLLQKGYITAEQILDIDCTIIDDCNGVLIYVPKDDELQGGRKIEYDYAVAHGKRVIVFDDIEYAAMQLANYIMKECMR